MKDVYQESDHLVKRARQLIVKVCERTSNRKLCSKALAAYDMQLEAAKQSKKKTTFLEWAAIQQSAIATVVDLLRQKRRGFLGRIGIRSSEIRELEVIAKRLRKLRTTAPKKAGTSPKPASSQTGVPFFDEAYYLSQCPEAKLSGRTPYEHYKNVGWKLGMDPHPGFATKWYLAHSPDVAALGLEPLKHYLEEGWKDGRSPCPTFGKAGTGVSPPPCSRQMSEADSLDLIDRLFLKSWRDERNLRQRKTLEPGQIHVLVVGHEASLTGAPICLLNLIRELQETGMAVCWTHLISGGHFLKSYAAEAPTLTRGELDKVSTCPDQAVARLAQWFSKLEGPKVVLCSTTVTHHLAHIIAACRLPLVGWIHEMPTFNKSHIGHAEMLAYTAICNRVIYPAELVRRANEQEFQLDRAKGTVIHYGGDHRLEDPGTGAKDFHELAGIPSGCKIVLASGTADGRKGPDLFVQVAGKMMSLLKEQGREVEMPHFVWIGAHNASWGPWCLHDAARLGVARFVHFPGTHDCPEPLYGQADVFILASREEPVGLVCLEALRNGVPVVLFQGVSGIVEYCPRGVYEVPYLDVGAMASQVVDLLTPNPMGEGPINNQDLAVQVWQRLRWERAAREFLTVFKEEERKFRSSRRILIVSYGQPPLNDADLVDGGALRNWRLAVGLKMRMPDASITLAFHETGLRTTLPAVADGVILCSWNEKSLPTHTAHSDVVIISYGFGEVSLKTACNLREDQTLVLDCYVPAYLEVAARDSSEKMREHLQYEIYRDQWNLILKKGHLFLCANEAQERFYTGVLSALGLFNPLNYGKNPILRVPYGISREEPQASSAPCTALLSHPTAWKLLWFGGVYPWFDIRHLMDATALLNLRHPTELIVVGAANPFVDQPDFVASAQAAIDHAQQEHLRGIVHFKDWVPYSQRADWYLDADVTVLISKPGIENQYAWRTRLVDCVWSGSLLATNGGDPLGDEIAANDACIRFKQLNAEAIATELYEALSAPSTVERKRRNLRAMRESLYLDAVVTPLVDHLRPVLS